MSAGSDYEDRPSNAQIDAALALGVEFQEGMKRKQLEQLMMLANRNVCNVPPTAIQKKVAKEWDVEIPAGASRSDVMYLLAECIEAKIWIYSVARHMARAKWRQYGESGLADDRVLEIARALAQDLEIMSKIHFETFLTREWSSSASRDDWYRFSRKTAKTDAYEFTADLLLRRLGHLKKGGVFGMFAKRRAAQH